MALPPEKISELKSIIHTQLSQLDIESRVQEVLSEVMGSENIPPGGKINEEQLIQALKNKGVVDDVMDRIKFTTSEPRPAPSYGAPPPMAQPLGHPPPKPATHFVNKDERFLAASSVKEANIDPSRRYIYMQFMGGKAFLEHLAEPSPLPGQVTSFFTAHVTFRGQRFKSRPTPCACEPDIQEGFLLELHKETSGSASKMADSGTMLSVADTIHVVLTKTEPSGETHLISSYYLHWRAVMSAAESGTTISAEMMGIGSESKVPVGVIQIRIELIPKLTHPLSDDIVSAQIQMEKSKQAERERLFLVYAKQWWKEYLQIRESHKERLVKIFAQDENGTNRPVCTYIRPLRAGRLIDSAREAARFVSLVGYEKTSTLGGGERAEMWGSMHSFLCRNKGDCEDHAVLLCSLLLGFGLDAFVCVGTKGKGASHTWVMTLSSEGIATFWESLTGHRYVHRPINPDDPPAVSQPKPAYPYKNIGCVFNTTSFYANCQASDLVETCIFDLHDDGRWKAMSEDALISVTGEGSSPLWPSPPPLCASTLDGALISNSLEQELRMLVMEHRRDQGLTTTWDDHLSYLLTPALSAYETERVTGVTSGNEEFQQAIRRAVPEGHTFKGYPIQFIHRNARRAFTACLKSPICEEIVNCRGDHVRLAVRVRVYTYPEAACATWIMFACKYKSIV